MNNIHSANIIKAICKQKGISISNLLSECNIRKGLIYDMEKRNQTPSAIVLEQIADYLDCSVDYLLGRTNIPEVNRSASSAENIVKYKNAHISDLTVNVKEPPIYDMERRIAVLGKVAAGTPILSYENDYGSIIPENPKSSYALIAQGDSMSPIILDREYIEVILQPTLEQGEIGIIRVNNSATCKKFYNFQDHYELRSINPDFATMTIKKTPSTILQIMGKVSLSALQQKRVNDLF